MIFEKFKFVITKRNSERTGYTSGKSTLRIQQKDRLRGKSLNKKITSSNTLNYNMSLREKLRSTTETLNRHRCAENNSQ